MRWFTQGVYQWRTGAAVVWACLFSCPALALYQLVALCSPLHPISWLQDWVNGVLSLRSAVFGCLYLITLSLACILYTLTCTVVLPVYKTRLSVIWGILRPSRLLVVASYALLGGGASYCLAELAGYHYLWGSHESCRYCLNEYLFFHTAHGVILGVRYAVRYYLHKEHLIVFPCIQQHKLVRLRGHVTGHVTDGLLKTLGGMRYFYPLYFLLGYYPRNRLIHTLGLQLRDDVRLTSLSSLMDLGLFVSILVAGTIIHVGWSFGLRIFRTFQTQAIKFPVVATFSGERERALTVALSCRTSPLVRYLGFLDLYELALHSQSRRAQVFGLDSEGRPAVWEVVIRECVSLMQELVSRLRVRDTGGHTTADAGTTSSPPPTTSPTSLSPAASLNGGSPVLREKGWPELPVGVLAPPGVSRRIANTEKMRLWSYSPAGVVDAQALPPAPPKPHPPHGGLAELKKRTSESLWSLLATTRANLRRKPFLDYFLAELPGATSQERFFDSRLQVWTITGISQLAVASYSEDKYGVVQRTLPEILSTLIGLSKELDRHVKAPLSNSKSTRNTRQALETNGKFAVKTAVQMALHSLAGTFANEMRSLQLAEEQVTYWNQFMGTKHYHTHRYTAGE